MQISRGYLVLLVLVPFVIAVELNANGKNVCMVEETYEIPVHVEKVVPEQYRTTGWCFGIPPRCTKYKTRWVTKTFTETRVQQRSVPRCCQGYVPNGVDCKAYCHDPCRHGVCTLPDTCTCFPGFRGPLCTAICARGTYGNNCTQSCECQNDAFCNPMNGVCLCTPGWRGKKCSDPCQDGYFGYECRRPCYCEGFSCHHITGECFYPTTVSTTEASTTEEPLTTTEISTTPTTSTELLTTSTTELPTKTDLSTSTEIPSTSSTAATFSSETTLTVSSTTEEIPADSGEESYTLIVSNNPPGSRQLAGLVWTIMSGIFSSLIILCAIAGLALMKLRKPPPVVINADTELYAFYAEIPQPVFQNPTYGIRTPDELGQKSSVQTFKNDESTFEMELREILEAQYDHLPPPRSRTPTPCDHLYDEILYNSGRRTNFS